MPNSTNSYRSAKPEHAALRERTMQCCSDAQSADGLLRSFGNLIIEELADLFSVDFVEDDGSFKRYVTLHLNDSIRERIERHREAYPLNRTAAYGYPRVIKTGKSQFIPGVTPHIAHRLLASVDSDPAAVGVRSFICVPLIAHGRTLGAITVANTERVAAFVADDLLLLEELAGLLAVRLDELI